MAAMRSISLAASCRVPHGDQHQRDVASRGGTAPLLDEPVVVDLQALEAELAVAGLHEQLPAEPRAGSESTATQARRSGPCPRLVPWRRSSPGASPSTIQWLGAELLLGLADDGTQTRTRALLAVVDPDVHAVVVGLHVRGAVPVLARRRGPPTGSAARGCGRRPRSASSRSIAAPSVSFTVSSLFTSRMLISPAPLSTCV